jgi:hypothetical protein
MTMRALRMSFSDSLLTYAAAGYHRINGLAKLCGSG